MDLNSILDDDDLDVQIIDDDDEVMAIDNDCPQINALATIKSEVKNPVEQHLRNQLQYAENLIDQSNSNIEIIENVTERILKHLATQAAYREDVSSESDSDLYSSTGEPFVKKKRNKLYERNKVLTVQEVWQRVIDDKWVIGVDIKSTTTCVLREPTIYILPSKRSDGGSCHGLSVFWSLIEGTNWDASEEIDSRERQVATAVLDLPSFDAEPELEAHGAIFCEFDGKLFQTAVPRIKLSVRDIVDGNCGLDFGEEAAEASILALKAISVDRVVLLPMQSDSNTGSRILTFLDRYAFKELCKVCVARNAGSLQYCLIELLPPEEPYIRILISARSEAQLSVVIQLLREDFPELLDIEKQQELDEAAEALCQELKLYLKCNDATELQRVRVKTDLLIP